MSEEENSKNPLPEYRDQLWLERGNAQDKSEANWTEQEVEPGLQSLNKSRSGGYHPVNAPLAESLDVIRSVPS